MNPTHYSNYSDRVKNMKNVLESRQKILALSLSILLVVLIGVIDSASGPEMSVAIFYVIPVVIAVTYIGPWTAVAISIASIITYFLADKVASISYSHPAIPYWNSAARIAFLLIVTYVLAKRKIADKRLAESEERFRLLVEGTKDYAILMLDSHGIINSWNTGAQRIFGYTSSEIIGRDFTSFYAKSEIRQYKPERLLATVLKEGAARDESICLRKDGSEFWADVVLTALPGTIGEIRGLALVVRDITERKEAEQSVRMFAALHEIDRAILRAPSLKGIAEQALEAIHTLIPFEEGSVLLFDFESDQATLLALRSGGKTSSLETASFSIDPDDDEIWSLKSGKVYRLENISSVVTPLLRVTQTSSSSGPYLSVPLLSKSELIGSLTLSMKPENPFTPQHLQIAREVCDQLAIAIHNSFLFQKVRVAHQRMQVLSHRLLELQESERRHLARELHDEIGQALTAIKIHLHEMDAFVQNLTASAHLGESIEIVDKLVQQVRSISLDLRPLMLDDLGLVAALRWYVARQAQLAGFSAHFTAPSHDINLPSELETTCFRIAQEALTNIVRHASAKHVYIEVAIDDDEMRLLIKDDGVGFDTDDVQTRAESGWSLGLLGMRERVSLVGGKIEIESVPLCGTEIRARFPARQLQKSAV